MPSLPHSAIQESSTSFLLLWIFSSCDMRLNQTLRQPKILSPLLKYHLVLLLKELLFFLFPYLKYKAPAKGGGRSRKRLGSWGKEWERREGDMGGWKPANEEGCSHREGVGSRTWVAGGARCGETWRTEASVVQGETPACPGRATTARIAMISEP